MNSFIVYLSILWYSFVDVNCTLVLLKTSSVQFLNLVALPSPVTCIWVFWKWIWPARNLMFQHCCQISVAIPGDLILYLSLSKYSKCFRFVPLKMCVLTPSVFFACLKWIHIQSYRQLYVMIWTNPLSRPADRCILLQRGRQHSNFKDDHLISSWSVV